jgi:hypothetical protein
MAALGLGDRKPARNAIVVVKIVRSAAADPPGHAATRSPPRA